MATVPEVDLYRYIGLWYDVAHLPNWFQEDCIGDTTARYDIRKDGSVSVVNRCRTEGGVDEVEGTASVDPGSGNARLSVSFFGPFSGPYWIIGLDPHYRWAVVGDPQREFLWILSRTPQLDAAAMAAARASAAAQGYDVSQIVPTLHTEEAEPAQ